MEPIFPQKTVTNPSREIPIQTPSVQLHVPQKAKLSKMCCQDYHCRRVILAV